MVGVLLGEQLILETRPQALGHGNAGDELVAIKGVTLDQIEVEVAFGMFDQSAEVAGQGGVLAREALFIGEGLNDLPRGLNREKADADGQQCRDGKSQC